MIYLILDICLKEGTNMSNESLKSNQHHLFDYFCYSVPQRGESDLNIQDTDNENTIWIKTQEKKLISQATQLDILIIFDRTTRKFYKNDQEIDITNLRLFPRSFIKWEKDLIQAITLNKGLPITTLKDIDIITLWPQYTQPLYRQIISTTYQEFQQNWAKYKKIFPSIFFKTALKSSNSCLLNYYGEIELSGKKFFVTSPTLFDINPHDIVFLSSPFESIPDLENDMDCYEYRAFVVNNTLLSLSRSYIDYPTDINPAITAFVKEQIKRNTKIPNFPSSYVLDVGKIKINNQELIDIIEYNPISSSGLEISHSLIPQTEPDNSPKTLKKYNH